MQTDVHEDEAAVMEMDGQCGCVGHAGQRFSGARGTRPERETRAMIWRVGKMHPFICDKWSKKLGDIGRIKRAA